MISILFLLLILTFETAYVDGETGNSEFRNVLSFTINLRSCAIHSEFLGIKLPELTSYATTSTSNMSVNMITEKEYIKFWQELRKWNYEQDRKRLSTLSMGATLALLSSPTANPKYDSLTGAAESSFLAPVLKGNLSKYHSNAMNTKEMHMLESLRIMIEASENYSGVERELVLGAVWLLDIATQISRVSWCYVSEEEKKDLRSNYRALKSIRDWDRNSSS